MTRHPGGEEHSRYLIELSFVMPPARWLDMGAGSGETVRLLRSLGYEAEGLDLEPSGEKVIKGDYLEAPYADESFDAIISQCSFFVSGDVPGALKEAGRMLKKGGKLVFSDVTRDVVKLLSEVRAAGFAVRHMEDMSDEWKEYYLEALWRDESNCLPTGKKVSYVLFICERL